MPHDARFTGRARCRILRWGTALYAIALFTGTHLPPRVVEDWSKSFLVSLSDKLLHFSAYLGLAALLMLTLGTFRRLGLREFAGVALLALTLGALDEWTQGLPGVNRSPELLDWTADALGVACGLAITAWLIARPKGTTAFGPT